MTILRHIQEHLSECGIFGDDSQAIIDQMQHSMPSMKDRWLDDAEGYADGLVSTLKFAARSAALTYLKFTKPQHFAISVLETP